MTRAIALLIPTTRCVRPSALFILASTAWPTPVWAASLQCAPPPYNIRREAGGGACVWGLGLWPPPPSPPPHLPRRHPCGGNGHRRGRPPPPHPCRTRLRSSPTAVSSKTHTPRAPYVRHTLVAVLNGSGETATMHQRQLFDWLNGSTAELVEGVETEKSPAANWRKQLCGGCDECIAPDTAKEVSECHGVG